jgi:hypothetical protein
MPDDNGDVDNCAGLRGELNMVRDKANPRRRNRAVTLIEAVLYISIALALIVGGLVFFQQASTAAKTSTMVRQLSTVVAETRALTEGIPLSDMPVDLDAFLISAGAVPSDMVISPTSISNPFGGTTELGQFFVDWMDPLFTLEVSNIPQGVCARLLTSSSGSDGFVSGGRGNVGFTTLLSSGTVMIVTRASTTTSGVFHWRSFAMNATQAGWMCKYGSVSYSRKDTEPTGATPLSGNVTITLFILLDA